MLRDSTKGGPLDDIVVAACRNWAQRCTSDERKAILERRINPKNFPAGYMAYFVQRQEKPVRRDGDFSDSDSNSDSQVRHNGFKEMPNVESTVDDCESCPDLANVRNQKIKNYFVYDRRKYLGHRFLEQEENVEAAKIWKKQDAQQPKLDKVKTAKHNGQHSAGLHNDLVDESDNGISNANHSKKCRPKRLLSESAALGDDDDCKSHKKIKP